MTLDPALVEAAIRGKDAALVRRAESVQMTPLVTGAYGLGG